MSATDVAKLFDLTGQVAGVALWLAGPASAWVTGEIIRVDGGKFRQAS